jgi:pimeloyl-ACP methyl ester carboxylesterase
MLSVAIMGCMSTAKETTGGSIGMTAGSRARVNGLDMYYEIHGTGRPLVLLHGALSATGTSFGAVLPRFAETRQVIAVEQQAHGRTADIDRPLRIEQMADDTASLLRHLGIAETDVFGYSMGAGIGLHLAIRHPDLVRRAALASVSYRNDGFHPGLLAGLEGLKPEMLVGTPWHEEYMRTAPRPEDFPRLVARVTDMNMSYTDLPAEAIRSIRAPVLLIAGDSDIVRPEHAVEMFRLLGGGVSGDTAGMPRSQLAILPGTSHTMMVQRGDWLHSMVTAFLDAPDREAT